MFEKNLIVKQIAASGQCPLTGVTLDASSDLIELKVAKQTMPRPIAATTFPGMLKLLQDEWDTVMLEVAQLKQEREHTRKELSAALYQQDAALQTICRLQSEKEQLQQ